MPILKIRKYKSSLGTPMFVPIHLEISFLFIHGYQKYSKVIFLTNLVHPKNDNYDKNKKDMIFFKFPANPF